MNDKHLYNKKILFTRCSDLMFLENKLSEETILYNNNGRTRESGE